VIIDASVWVARFLAGDVHHESATACLTRGLRYRMRMLVPVLAWPEVAGAIARRTGSAEAAIAAVRLLQERRWIEAVAIDSALGRAAATLASEHKLRGADAVYVALAAATGLPLITLDAEMLERRPPGVASLTPAEWLQREVR
jgi:predicted nucleic acid-binding protein